MRKCASVDALFVLGFSHLVCLYVCLCVWGGGGALMDAWVKVSLCVSVRECVTTFFGFWLPRCVCVCGFVNLCTRNCVSVCVCLCVCVLQLLFWMLLLVLVLFGIGFDCVCITMRLWLQMQVCLCLWLWLWFWACVKLLPSALY